MRHNNNEEQFDGWLRGLIAALHPKLSEFGMTSDQLEELEQAECKLSDAIDDQKAKREALEACQRELREVTRRVRDAEVQLTLVQEDVRLIAAEADSLIDPLADSLYNNPRVSDRFIRLHGLESITPQPPPQPSVPELTGYPSDKGVNFLSWRDRGRCPETIYHVEAVFGTLYRGNVLPPNLSHTPPRVLAEITENEYSHKLSSKDKGIAVAYRILAREGGSTRSSEWLMIAGS